MDVQFVPKTTLPSSGQPSAQPVAGNQTAAKSASKPVAPEQAQAVTASANVDSHKAERRQDRIAEQGEERVSPHEVLDSLRLSSHHTQLEFDRELDTVVVQVVDTRTEEIIETIPSEELLRHVRQLAGTDTPPSSEDTGGGAVFDKSV